MRKLAVFALMATLSLTLIGCSTNPKPTTLPPGAYSTADAQFYDALVTARGAIDAVCDVGTSVSTGNCIIKYELAAYKPQINQAIASWNIAASAEMTYRNALKNGGTPDSAAVMAAVNQVTTNTAALVTSISGGH